MTRAKKGNWNTCEEQRKRLLAALHERNLTTWDCRNDPSLDVMHPGGRIFELRKEGYNIVTEFVREPNSEGVLHQIARYVLFAGKI